MVARLAFSKFRKIYKLIPLTKTMGRIKKKKPRRGVETLMFPSHLLQRPAIVG